MSNDKIQVTNIGLPGAKEKTAGDWKPTEPQMDAMVKMEIEDANLPTPTVDKLELHSDFLLCLEVKREKKVGSLYMAETHTPLAGRYKVVSIADKVVKCKPGDTILFNNHLGTKVMIDDVEHVLVHEEDIYGRILPDKKDA
jgi:co-chaperonin GroES (HSP10)